MSAPKLTAEQAAIVGAYTGTLAGALEDYRRYVTRLLGRPVYTHELGSQEIKDAARKDFLAICAKRKAVSAP